MTIQHKLSLFEYNNYKNNIYVFFGNKTNHYTAYYATQFLTLSYVFLKLLNKS